MKKFMLFWIIGSVVSLYTTFVIQNLWNWFATVALHVSEIPFWVMFGLVLLIGLFTDIPGNFEEQQRFEALSIVLWACVPESKRQEAEAELKEHVEVRMWLKAGTHIFGKVVGTTFVLGVGFVVHLFLA